MKTGRLSKSIAKVSLALGALLVALGVCEIVVRCVGLAPAIIPIGISSENNVYRRSDNPILSYEFKPNYRNDSADLRFDYGLTNSQGQRDVERRYEKPSDVRRVILLGDSVVVGYGVREIDQLMSRQLERLYPDETVEVLNLGMTGYCTRAEVELLRVKGVRYDPDLVIVVFTENDFRNFNPDALATDGIANRPFIVTYSFQKSYLFRMACSRLNWFGMGLETDPAFWNQRAIGDNNVEDGFRLLRQLATQYGFQVVVAVWPTFTNSEIHEADKMWMPDAPDQLIVEQLAQSYGLPVFRLSEPFQSQWQSLRPRPSPRAHYTVGDEMHPSATGHRVAAKILKELIEANRLLDADQPIAVRSDIVPKANPRAVNAAMALGSEKADYGLVYFNRGIKLLRQDKVDEAIEQFHETIRTSPRYADDAHIHIGQALAERGQTRQAAKHYREALENNSNHYIAHVNLGNILRRTGDLENAIQHFRQAAELRPDQFAGHFGLAISLKDQGNLNQAAQHLRIASEIRPNSAKVTRQLAHVDRMTGRVDRAILQYRRAMKLDPGVAQDHSDLGLALAMSARLVEATDQFRKGLDTDPNHAELHFNLGKALSHQGQLTEALQRLRRAQELAPDEARICSSLGVVLTRLQRPDEAIEQFTQALQLDPENVQAKRNLEALRTRHR